MVFGFAFVCFFVSFVLSCLFLFFSFGGGGYYTLQRSSLLHKINSCRCISMKLDVFRKAILRTVVLY